MGVIWKKLFIEVINEGKCQWQRLIVSFSAIKRYVDLNIQVKYDRCFCLISCIVIAIVREETKIRTNENKFLSHLIALMTQEHICQNSFIVWLDNDINEDETDTKISLQHLHTFVHQVMLFEQFDHCLQYLQTIEKRENFCYHIRSRDSRIYTKNSSNITDWWIFSFTYEFNSYWLFKREMDESQRCF